MSKANRVYRLQIHQPTKRRHVYKETISAACSLHLPSYQTYKHPEVESRLLPLD